MVVNEDMGRDEELVAREQSIKVRRAADNTRHGGVHTFRIILWSVLALLALCGWLLRLLGIVRFI